MSRNTSPTKVNNQIFSNDPLRKVYNQGPEPLITLEVGTNHCYHLGSRRQRNK